jgi:hypothetical protein
MTGGEVRDGVSLTNLDQPLFDEAAATKRDLVDYLDAVRDRIIPELRDRPLSVLRVLRGQAPFMQKNGRALAVAQAERVPGQVREPARPDDLVGGVQLRQRPPPPAGDVVGGVHRLDAPDLAAGLVGSR